MTSRATVGASDVMPVKLTVADRIHVVAPGQSVFARGGPRHVHTADISTRDTVPDALAILTSAERDGEPPALEIAITDGGRRQSAT